MSRRLKAPACTDCPSYVYNWELSPIFVRGVAVQSGERYCFERRRPRRFRRNDSRRSIPDWCPGRKSPCEVRIYDFKSDVRRSLYLDTCACLGKEIPPMAHDYALIKKLHSSATPQSFLEAAEEGPEEDLLGVPVALYQVVEIDDGIRPVCFYKSGDGYRLISWFNAQEALRNHRMGTSGGED